MKKTYIKKCLESLKRCLLYYKPVQLMVVTIAKYVSLSNRKYKIQPTIINLHPNEYSQELHYYPFAIKLDKYIGSLNTFNDLSNKVCVQNEMEDLNIHVFNVITGKNESKIWTKDISHQCKYKFDGRKCNSNQNWNNDKCQYECKKYNVHEKDYTWNPAIYIVVKMVNIQQVLLMIQWLRLMKLYKKQKLFQQILMKKCSL